MFKRLHGANYVNGCFFKIILYVIQLVVEFILFCKIHTSFILSENM